jgi:orotate phosphoribosyltransferase
MSLFQLGDFILASGKKSPFKIDCDFLSWDDWQTLAFLLAQRVQTFCDVYGVPTGGEMFAKALKPYAVEDSEYILIVDDVWTTGESMNKFETKIGWDTGWRYGLVRAVAFARAPVPISVTALFSLSPPPHWARMQEEWPA